MFLKCGGEPSIKVLSTAVQCWDRTRNCWRLSCVTEEHGDSPQVRACGDARACSLKLPNVAH